MWLPSSLPVSILLFSSINRVETREAENSPMKPVLLLWQIGQVNMVAQLQVSLGEALFVAISTLDLCRCYLSVFAANALSLKTGPDKR